MDVCPCLPEHPVGCHILGHFGRAGPAAGKADPLPGIPASRTSAGRTLLLAQSPGPFPLISLVAPCSSLRQHVLPSPDCPAPRHTGLREPRLGQEEASAQPQNFSHNSLRAARPQDPSEEGVGLSLAGPSDFGFLHASGSIESKAKPAQPQPTGEKEQDKSKLFPLRRL